MARDQRLTLYVGKGEKGQIEEEADERDLSVSEYLYRLVQKQRQSEAAERLIEESEAERHIEQLLADGRDELVAVADDVRDLSARGNVYAIALWELLKTEHPDTERREALSTAARRLRIPVEEHPDLHPADVDTDGDADRDDGGDVDEEGASEGSGFGALRDTDSGSGGGEGGGDEL
ncbi:hypothetical protein ACFQPA_21900 [Halomarina halobia]|uniref:Uncharacterized protein n=1 Tax=Halomarina halobia TaxID=3033386 RepID=A0ABD6AF96_9EURY|nr:hypothetical protein [Halomarina sp. PSR21]